MEYALAAEPLLPGRKRRSDPDRRGAYRDGDARVAGDSGRFPWDRGAGGELEAGWCAQLVGTNRPPRSSLLLRSLHRVSPDSGAPVVFQRRTSGITTKVRRRRERGPPAVYPRPRAVVQRRFPRRAGGHRPPAQRIFWSSGAPAAASSPRWCLQGSAHCLLAAGERAIATAGLSGVEARWTHSRRSGCVPTSATSATRRGTSTSSPAAGCRAEAVRRRPPAAAPARPASAASGCVRPTRDRAWPGPSHG